MSTNPVFISKDELLRRKKARRHDLAKLPIEEKIKIVIELQRIAAEIACQTGRNYRTLWFLSKRNN